jgi:hypothetical protein
MIYVDDTKLKFTRPEMIDQNHIYYIFPSDQRDQQISSRYDFDQLFPVGYI